MNWIMDNWQFISCIIGIIVAVLIVIFVPKNWLLAAVMEAEQLYGDGAGPLQKAVVYRWFTKAFPIISKFMPMPLFSILVDAALKKMHEILEAKPKIVAIIKPQVYSELAGATTQTLIPPIQ